MNFELTEELRSKLLAAQRSEITEQIIYQRLSESTKDSHNRDVLKKISEDERDHYHLWKGYTGADVEPNRLKIFVYMLLARIFGITFSIRLMEKDESNAQLTYQEISKFIPEAQKVIDEENAHEQMIIDLIKESHLGYRGSVVLGLNDALVELTGALAGFTLAFQNSKLILAAGLITGIAASLSMAASEYLSTKADKSTKNPFKAAIYTGMAYIITVFFLILPFFLFQHPNVSLIFTLVIALFIIFIYNYYLSVVQDIHFWRRFGEMAVISLGIAGFTFLLGWIISQYIEIEL